MVLLNTWLSKSVWHYFTGMLLQDVTLFPVSMVVEKKNAWNVWERFSEIIDVFARLSLGSVGIADDHLTLIERFVALLYDRTGIAASANGARCWLFKKECRSALQP